DWSYLKHKNWSDMSIPELMERAKIGNPNTGMPYKTKWIIHCIMERPNPRPLLEEFAKLKGYLPAWIDKCLSEHAKTEAKRIIRNYNNPILNPTL
ncbi:hypothetical protein QNI19_38995, partial [Cytophagaceae bacterium DM2B3-1]